VSRSGWGAPAAAFGLGAVATALTATLLGRRPPGGAGRWTRTNHRSEPVSLLEGPAVVAGLALAAACAPGLRPRVRAAAAAAVLAAGALGAYDDLAEGQARKGLAGHLGALTRGELTTGGAKVLGLTASGLLAAVLVGAPGGPVGAPDEPVGAPAQRVVDAVVGAAVVAGWANLVNLLDLRPGRALKVALLALLPALAGAGAPLAAAAAGSAVAALPADLAERTMLGDTGANALGALLGVGVLAGSGRRGRAVVLAGLVALTLASERISFTRVIGSTPGLRQLDGLGRRPR
jgi:UDP-GlcNAc:undecaprenyl-phosphate GlcNAc-1-phosphate transferase